MTSSPNDQMIHLRAIRSERRAASDRNTCARSSESATSIVIGDHFSQFVSEQVRSGRYGSTSDVVRAGFC